MDCSCHFDKQSILRTKDRDHRLTDQHIHNRLERFGFIGAGCERILVDIDLSMRTGASLQYLKLAAQEWEGAVKGRDIR
jgi:hypothetical protein